MGYRGSTSMGLDIYIKRFSKKEDRDNEPIFYQKLDDYKNKLSKYFKKKEEIKQERPISNDEWWSIVHRINNGIESFCSEKQLKHLDKLKNDYQDSKPKRMESLYMRKQNWFLRYIHSRHEFKDGDYYCQITKEDVIEFISRADAVLNATDDTKRRGLAMSLLPTQEGFFFGATDYDDYYYTMVKHYRDAYEEALKEIDWDKEYIEYYESW